MTAIQKLQGPKILLQGDSGTGKTYACGSLLDEGSFIKRIVYISFEPGATSLRKYFSDRKKDLPAEVHTVTIQSSEASFADIAAQVKNVRTLSFETLCRSSDSKRGNQLRLEQFLETFNAVKTDAGIDLGSATDFDHTTAVIVDGLTGLADAAFKVVIGNRPTAAMNDYQVGMNLIQSILRTLTTSCNFTLVVLAHVDQENIEGVGTRRTAKSLGSKLAPIIPAMFNDVIASRREGDRFHWDTSAASEILRTTHLPIADKQQASFLPLLKAWEKINVSSS